MYDWSKKWSHLLKVTVEQTVPSSNGESIRWPFILNILSLVFLVDDPFQDMTPWVKLIFCKTMLVRIMCQVSGVISVMIVQRKLQMTPFQILHPYSSICPWIIATEAFFILFPGLYDVLPHHICVRKLFFFSKQSFATDLTAKTHKQRGDELLKVAPRLVRPQLVAFNTSAKIIFPWGGRWCNIYSGVTLSYFFPM